MLRSHKSYFKKARCIALFCTGLMFFNCGILIISSHYLTGKNNDYYNQEFIDDEIVLLPINPENIFFTNGFSDGVQIEYEFKKTFDLSGESTINQQISDVATKHMDSYLNKYLKAGGIRPGVIPNTFNRDSNFWMVTFHEKVNENSISKKNQYLKMQRPRIDAYKNQGIKSRFGIVIGKLAAYPKPPTTNYKGQTEPEFPKIVIEIEYLIFDYDKNKPVSWGGVSTESLDFISKPKWINIFCSLMKNILKKSPFKS